MIYSLAGGVTPWLWVMAREPRFPDGHSHDVLLERIEALGFNGSRALDMVTIPQEAEGCPPWSPAPPSPPSPPSPPAPPCRTPDVTVDCWQAMASSCAETG